MNIESSASLHTRNIDTGNNGYWNRNSERDHLMQEVQSYHEAPAFVQMPVKATHRRNARRRSVRQGAQIFDKAMPLSSAYTVASGEVLILRDGQLIDMVEAGELLDQRIWSDATAIAHTDCTLAPRLPA